MPSVQTVPLQENDVRMGGNEFVCGVEANEQKTSATANVLTREHVLNGLLETFNKEETAWQKRLSDGGKISIVAVLGLLTTCMVRLLLQHVPPQFASAQTLQTFISASFAICLVFCSPVLYAMVKIGGYSAFNPFGSLITHNNRPNSPLHTSQVQQDAITALLNYADDPRVAEALCHAIPYYGGDRNVLYLRLARVLPLLPNDPAFLTETARRILKNTSDNYNRGPGDDAQRQTLPVLQAAAKEYFARTGEPAPRPKRKGFQRGQAARHNAKEVG